MISAVSSEVLKDGKNTSAAMQFAEWAQTQPYYKVCLLYTSDAADE